MRISIQQGATLIELLISVLIGLIIAASMMGVYLTSTANSSQILKSSKLNQELTTLMTVMINDIRRAGYTGDTTQLLENKFSYFGSNQIRTVGNDCILYAYDSDTESATGPTKDDMRGFRLIQTDGTGVVQMLSTKDSETAVTQLLDDFCTGIDYDTYWSDLTDSKSINIKTLEFYLKDDDDGSIANTDSVCLNLKEDGNVDDCTSYYHAYLNHLNGGADPNNDTSLAPTDEDFIRLTHHVEIKMTGNLVKDEATTLTLGNEITPLSSRVRNDIVWRGKLP
jgi:type IV pilus assembly protein PilW